MNKGAFDRIRGRDGAQATPEAKPTIRRRLLLAVNLPLVGLLVVFLAYDYSRELSKRLDDKRISLEEEAKTVLPAVLQVRHHGSSSVQQYIDTVCGRMQDADSPGHHIAVELGGEFFQAAAHHRASPEIMLAMRKAQSSNGRATLGQTELVVGVHHHADATVYVAESLEHVRRSVMDDILRQLAGFTLLAAVAALVVNAVVTRVVSRPLERLVGTVQEIGAGRLGAEAESFSTAELDYLAGEINSMSHSLAAADQERQVQMAKARDIQRNLLPQDIDMPGIHVAHVFEPAEDVGGDYYDIIPLDDGAFLFCVADVTGHGVPAAMTAAMLKMLLLQAAEQFISTAEMMSFINLRLIEVNLTGDFVTMLLVRVDPRTGCLAYASAGHEPAWLVKHAGDMREITSTGMILGVETEASWDDMVTYLVAGDRLLIVTDGASESSNHEGQMFGRQRLACLLEECGKLPVEQVVQRLYEALEDFRGETAQTDDVTIVLMEKI